MPPLQTLSINVCVRNVFEINPETIPEVEHKHTPVSLRFHNFEINIWLLDQDELNA